MRSKARCAIAAFDEPFMEASIKLVIFYPATCTFGILGLTAF